MWTLTRCKDYYALLEVGQEGTVFSKASASLPEGTPFHTIGHITRLDSIRK